MVVGGAFIESATKLRVESHRNDFRGPSSERGSAAATKFGRVVTTLGFGCERVDQLFR